MCEHKFFLEYNLGISPLSGHKADKGNVVHKALEILANVSICDRDGKTSYEDDTFGNVLVESLHPDWAIKRAFDHYTSLSPHHDWTGKDFQDCKKWMYTALNFNKGQYDPRNLDIIHAEGRFDFIIEDEWAKYDYTLEDGTKVEGNLGIKGTIDLIVKDKYDKNVIEVIDWKTGARKDWSKEGWEKKSYEDLRWDNQLCLYHYAVTRMFPDIEDIFITIFYINDGGPFRFCFEKKDVEYTKNILKEKFNEIRKTKIPKLSIGRKCTSFCYFGMNLAPQDSSKTICEFFKDIVRKDGITKVISEHGRDNAWTRYGSGGGRTDAE